MRYISDMATAEIADLLARALRLPPGERLAMATELLESVEGPEDEAWTTAWAAELDRRVQELDSGRIKAVPWEKAKAEILKRLRER